MLTWRCLSVLSRLILYFPVSALVTLFANVLQNPQDARARADVRLMNRVVSFLSMLSAEEENSGVHRMLGVCSEFERIANVVLDRAEASSRRKRSRAEDPPKDASRMASSPSRQPPPAEKGPSQQQLFTPRHSVEMGKTVRIV